MKTICAMRDVFKAMGNFETAFEKMYQITLNEAMILCALKEASDKVTATNLSKQTTRKVEKGSRGNFFCRKINIFLWPGGKKNGERSALLSGSLLTVYYLQIFI